MKKRIAAILVCGVIAAGLIGCGSSSEETETEAETEAEETEAEETEAEDETEAETESEPESETAVTFDRGEPVVSERTGVQDGDVIGEYSVLEVPQSEVTLDYLTDWYENYVQPSGHDWDFIVYSDGDDHLGVWANDSSVYRDVYLLPNESSGYRRGENSSTTICYVYTDGELVEQWNAAESGPESGKTPEEVLGEYIDSGDYYPARWDFVDRLETLGFSTEEAEAAVESVDWNELAVEDLQSDPELAGDADKATQFLEQDGYTDEEIRYALDKTQTE